MTQESYGLTLNPRRWEFAAANSSEIDDDKNRDQTRDTLLSFSFPFNLPTKHF